MSPNVAALHSHTGGLIMMGSSRAPPVFPVSRPGPTPQRSSSKVDRPSADTESAKQQQTEPLPRHTREERRGGRVVGGEVGVSQ